MRETTRERRSGNQIINTRAGIYFFWEQENQGEFWWLDINQYPSRNNQIFNNTAGLIADVMAGLQKTDQTNVVIADNVFSDDQTVPTQLYPITINGPVTPSNVMITGNGLTSYGSGVSIRLIGGASLAASYGLTTAISL